MKQILPQNKNSHVLMERKSVRSRKNNKKEQHLAIALLSALYTIALINIPAYASGVDEVLTPLNSLKTLVIAIIGAVGVIILAKNVMEFAQSYQQQDSSTMNAAIKGIVAGLLMAGISAVLTFLGF